MGYLCEFVILLMIFQQFKTEDACSSKLCQCSEKKVVCVGLNLTYIPRLPKSTVTFDFIQNYLPNVSEDTFQNISSLKITYLVLKSNRITLFHKDPFKQFRNLRRLDMSDNKLTLDSVRNVFYTCNVHSIGGIYLKNIGLTNLPSDAFQGPLEYFLKAVDLSRNSLRIVNLTDFKSLTHLKVLNLESNELERIITHTLPSLQHLYLNANYLRDVPQFCSDGSTLFPSLSKLSLINNTICEYIPENVNCLNKLAQLDISNNCIYIIKSNSFSSLPRLSLLRIISQRSPRSSLQFEKYALNNSHLRQLQIDRNRILIKYFDELTFVGCHNLQYLDFSANTLRGYIPENIGKLNRILSPLKQLRKLQLGYSYLNSVPSVIQTFPKLQHLLLEGNHIATWPKGTFDSNPFLTYLNLHRNEIRTVTEDMFSSKVRNQLKTIGLGGNPFVCDCKLVWFIQWLNHDHEKFLFYPDSYKCVNITERICLNNIVVFKSVIGVSCVILLILFIISIIFKYRWSIKYQIYIWRHQSQKVKKIQERQFEYDVFVSYSAKDGNWVWDQLAPRLEGEDNLKLCVHERDFDGGKLIIDNIVESIEDSRHALIVVSNNFASSDWCKFEMTLAQKHFLNELIEPLVVVLLEDIEVEFMSKILKALLSTTTYLTWNEKPEVAAMFWDKLRRSLKKQH